MTGDTVTIPRSLFDEALALAREISVQDKCEEPGGYARALGKCNGNAKLIVIALEVGAESLQVGTPCPRCGEFGGEPRTVVSREFQGDQAHGGMVEHEDEGCSLCL